MLKRMTVRQATESKAPTWLDAPLAVTQKRRRIYRDQVIVRDPFDGKTCPGCGTVFRPDYPPMLFLRKGRDGKLRTDPAYAHLAGRCLACAQHAAGVRITDRQ